MPNNLPSVTFLVPIRNERGFIRECLEAVRSQDYPSELVEIIVIDGISDDGTQDIPADLARREPRLKVIENPARIVPAAMNLGICQAKGEVIIRVDACDSKGLLRCVRCGPQPPIRRSDNKCHKTP